jgi:hypothetical protein
LGTKIEAKSRNAFCIPIYNSHQTPFGPALMTVVSPMRLLSGTGVDVARTRAMAIFVSRLLYRYVLFTFAKDA